MELATVVVGKRKNNPLRKVAITGHVHEDLNIEREELRKIGALVIDADKVEPDKLIQILKDTDALLVGDTIINEKMINNMDKCKVIVEYGSGVDNIDIETASNRGIIVTNVPDYGTGEVADQAIALLLALAKKICKLNSSVKTIGWSEARNLTKLIFRLKDKILGVIGYGRIGRAFAERAKPFGFKIYVYDPYQNTVIIKEQGFWISTFESLLKESDFISIRVPLTKETYNLFNEHTFRLMKQTAYLINVVRGAIIDENALLIPLKKEWIEGAVLDVLVDSPAKPKNPLINYLMNNDNLLIVPHTAWYSEESERELRTRAVKEAIRVLCGEKPESQVNKL